MFGSLGMGEILLVGIVALIVIGPDKLPQVARTIGKSLAEFRRVSNELRWQVMASVEAEEQAQKAKPASSTTPPPSTPAKPQNMPPKPKPIIKTAKHLDAQNAEAEADSPEAQEAAQAEPKPVHMEKTRADIAKAAGIEPEENEAAPESAPSDDPKNEQVS